MSQQCMRCGISGNVLCPPCGKILKNRRDKTPDVKEYCIKKIIVENKPTIQIPDHWHWTLKFSCLNHYGGWDHDKLELMLGGDQKTFMGKKIEIVEEEMWYAIHGEP